MSILTKLQDLRIEEEQSNDLCWTVDISDSEAMLKRITELTKIVAEHETKWLTFMSEALVDLNNGIFYTSHDIAPVPSKSFYYGSRVAITTNSIVVIHECA